MFLQQLINGITQGGLIALLAISYSLVYGVMNLVNFATGSIYMLGAYGGWLIVSFVCDNLWLAILGGGFAGFAVAFILEKLAFKSMRGISRVASLICTIGFSQLLNELMALVFTRYTRSMPSYYLGAALSVGGVEVKWIQLVLIAVVLAILAALQYFINGTKTGLAIRTVALDLKTAGLMGIDVDRTTSIAFSIAGACAGVSGVLGAAYYSAVSPTMGAIPGLKAFSAAVFGGLSSLPGAILGGYLLGIIENFGVQIFSSGYRDIISFAILILFLLIRPQGILGGKKITKV